MSNIFLVLEFGQYWKKKGGFLLSSLVFCADKIGSPVIQTRNGDICRKNNSGNGRKEIVVVVIVVDQFRSRLQLATCLLRLN